MNNKKNLTSFLFLILILCAHSFTIPKTKSSSASDNTIKDNGKSISSNTPAPSIKENISNLIKKCDPCPDLIKCVPHIQCPAHVVLKKDEYPQLCELADGQHGLCCTTGQNHTDHTKKTTNSKSTLRFHEKEDTLNYMQSIAQQARSKFTEMYRDVNLAGYEIERERPEFSHNMNFRSPGGFNDKRIMFLTHHAIEEALASKLFKEREHISNEIFNREEFDYGFAGTVLEETCLQKPKCHSHESRYPLPDGTCNNPISHHSTWGSAGYPMQRILPPAYEDGIWAPRIKSVTGNYLRSARFVSRLLFEDVDRPHEHLNLLVMQFGQFVSHDVTQSSTVKLSNGNAVSCCSEDGSQVLPSDMLHFACLPITIDPEDNFYSRFNHGCINFVRSSLAPQDDCKIGYAKQLNKVTHFLDGSMIYGSDLQTQNDLRLFANGQLRMFNDFGKNLLPLSNEQDACNPFVRGRACFSSGDGRVNQIISLTALHTIFAREHNRVADILGRLNPHWTDELLFLETKRIVVAEYQVIIYKEYLPLLLGTEAMDRFNLRLNQNGYSTDYDANVNPSITSEFSAAAYRMGHSIVDGKFNINHANGFHETIILPEIFFNPSRLRQNDFLDELLNTLVNQPMQKADSAVTQGLTHYLFQNDQPFGLDLAALNIQRGRDHALRSYNDYVEVSGRKRITHFSEFGVEAGAKLASVYEHPDDIDLWVGGLFEEAQNDGILGPTFTDIIADQFSRLRRGDRYFFEHGSEINPGFFSLKQIEELKHVSMAGILCDNSDRYALHTIPLNAFIRTGSLNQVRCGSDIIPSLNLLPWQESL